AVLDIGEFIGAGTYGVVFQGRYNTRKAAIKKFRLYQHTTDQVRTIEEEIEMLRHLQYRHIIQFYGVHRQGNEISLVTDFAEGGSLKQAIEDSRVAGWHIKIRIAQEIADGLAYIHHEGILHRDLKSDNVLLTGHMEVKLCDFGLAVIKTSSGGHSTEVMRGTFRWLAPELVLSERPRYSTKSDMYALGMVMWEMASMCTIPFRTMSNNVAVAQAVHGGRREQLPDETPIIYWRWVHLCWKQSPSDRPDAHEMTIMDDVSSERELTNTVGTSVCMLTTNAYEQGTASTSSSSVFSATQEPGAVHPPMDFFSLNRKATLNDVDAQVSLAEMYETGGNGVPNDNEMAFVWYLRAAQQGHVDAMARVGDMYAEGRGTEQSDDEAARWHKQATDQRPNLDSSGSSLRVMMDVLDTNQDRVQARAEIQAAERGDARAQFNVGCMYFSGRGVEESDVEAVKWFTMAASQGHPNAQNNLGVMYENGQGVEQSDVEAVEWYTKAANQGDPDGQSSLGRMYLDGRGVDQSDIEAVKWFTKAADQGDPDGQVNLGVMYSNGRGVKQSHGEAFKWYTKAASQEDPDAQKNLGVMYKYGQGVEQSDVEAVKWFAKAASQGNPTAQYNLGWMYKNGRGVEQSDVEAVKWYTEAASQGNPDGEFSLGWMYFDGRGVEQSEVEAIKWYTKVASQGDPIVQYILGWIYENSRGVAQSDVEAVRWYTESASRGYPAGEFSLGWMYFDGRGVEQSDVEAVKWYTKAANQRNLNAQSNLGWMYEVGRGVEQSDVEAVKWFTKAADRRDPDGMYKLGWMHEHGRGVEQSDVKAVEWYTRAADGGSPDGEFSLGLMYRNGRGVKQCDVRAVKWFTKAASQGNPIAQYNLGWMCETGRGVEQSDVEAVKWYTTAASPRNSNAQSNLGSKYDGVRTVGWDKYISTQGHAYGRGNLASMYELGFGVEASDEHALDLFLRANDKGYPNAHFHVEWLTSSDRRTPRSDSDTVEVNRIGADKGYVAAQHNLGRLYERGRGVRMDKVQACAWYRMAAAQGHEDSQQRMEFLQIQKSA
ncbi:hypothetical protein DFQ27_000147, partial [Actinomortierella ambigua]